VDDEEKKKAERAQKFGLDAPLNVKGLDEALPERRKRGRDASDRQGGRGPKRQTPDRRTEAPSKNSAKPQARPPIPAQKPLGKISDDPSEKAKAEARAKRFASAS
jgi:SAP domain-containing ribonucleoprotein